MNFIRNLVTPNARDPIILFYHGVIPRVVNSTIQGVHHSVRQFDRQMRFLSSYWDVVTLSEITKCLNDGIPIPPNQVVVTFDDGFRNNLEFAAEIVSKYEIKPTLFVCSENVRTGEWFPTSIVRSAIWLTDRATIRVGALGRTFSTETRTTKKKTLGVVLPAMKYLPADDVRVLIEEAKTWLSTDRWNAIRDRYSSENVLSWDELRLLTNSGWEIGSHTKGHVILHEMQPASQVRQQISGSKRDLEQELGSCDYFAFPNGEQGYVSARSVKEVENADYLLGLSAVPGTLTCGVNRLVLPRRLAPKGFLHFLSILNNSYRYDRLYANWLSSLGEVGVA